MTAGVTMTTVAGLRVPSTSVSLASRSMTTGISSAVVIGVTALPSSFATGALMFVTESTKSSKVLADEPSVAVTRTVIKPTSPMPGVPLNVLVAASKPSQNGSVAPLDRAAV